jgi:hypothetical protein
MRRAARSGARESVVTHSPDFKMEAAVKAQEKSRSRAKEPNLGQKEAQLEQKSEREISQMGELTKQAQSGARDNPAQKKIGRKR